MNKHLFRTFFAQFFTSETVTSDVQMRQAIIGVIAFILTPCLLILFNVFPQFQLLVIHVGRIHPPPGVITRATAVRNMMADDMTEWILSVLVGYSMITIGLLTVFAWDALSFDRRDAMVLGPLPLRSSDVILAKLAALAVFLVGSAVALNLLNASLFGLETADQLGLSTAVAHFISCLVVTIAAATLVFATIVTLRNTIAIVGGPRLATTLGAVLQFLFVVALLLLVVAVFASPVHRGRVVVPDTNSPPLTWFTAAFEVLRRSDRGAWATTHDVARGMFVLVPLSIVAAIATSVVAFRRQMQLALTPVARPGVLGRARLTCAMARLLGAGDRRAHAMSDFVITTIVRSRAVQAPIAINAAIGFTMIVIALSRERGDATTTMMAAPLMIGFWTAIGLRAAFYVPSELPSAWTFHAHAPAAFASYARGVRASIVALLAPLAAIAAYAAGGWRHAVLVAVSIAALADILVLTIDFLPFTRAYEPGHARLKSRWPLYLLGAVAFAFGTLRLPVWFATAVLVALELSIAYATRGWSLQPDEDAVSDAFSVTTLDLTRAFGGAAVMVLACTTIASAQVLTSQYDNARTGATTIEKVLTPANVNVRQFGKVFSYAVDGDVYAQPLFVPGVEIPGKGRHDVVYIATEHDSVYAFDAGNQPAAPLWHVSFLSSKAATLTPADVNCPFINPEIGITTTPVIDRDTGTLYVLARTKESTGALMGARFAQKLHALAITTGAEKFGGPVEIQSPGFDPLRELSRAALLLSQRQVFLTWGSSCDVKPYTGWVMAYDARTLKQTAVLNVAPGAGESGIWQSDMGPAADDRGYIYVVTGNGKFTVGAGGHDFGDSVLKLQLKPQLQTRRSTLSVVDHFTPPNQAHLNERDLDLGAGGPLLIDGSGAHPRLLIVGGKEPHISVLDRGLLEGGALQSLSVKGGTYSTPAYWNGHVFALASNDSVRDYRVANGQLTTAATSGPTFLNPGAAPVISSNGTRDGIVWVVATHVWNDFRSDKPAILYAFEAANIANELYNSGQNFARDRAGRSLRFVIPTVANGRVYVGTRKQVDVYGPIPSPK
ncbi:MAG TPA: hypothetical protein VFA59_00625 [Vicinamibacterales bacterium]|nr:hypothetical protein [Vicinamibacterales bacterium]